MTNNDISIDERVELKNSISLNWENAMYLFNNFKHIKWHTLYDFWVGLRDEANEYFQNAVLYPDSNEFVDSLTSISHNNKNCNHGVVFEDSTGKKIYVSGMDALSWGIVEPKSWLDFKDEELQGIVFSTFNTKNSWRLIDKNNMKKAIGKIINEIREEQINNYCRMHFE